ncbi:hypothetical protein LR48_Vigan05g079400 [Vigna angularis]|uniref:Uncharacterized protein n=1 Tax=Phaseolus angularis TaxID=3914 RepID=A0A0L9UJY1_PHAAN|nr:hypothetical protein LR48_Vigan05g079400 [Vigna angularis]
MVEDAWQQCSGRPSGVDCQRRGGVRWRVRTCAGGEESKSEILNLFSTSPFTLLFASFLRIPSLPLLSAFSLSLRKHCFIPSNSGFRQRGRTLGDKSFQRRTFG